MKETLYLKKKLNVQEVEEQQRLLVPAESQEYHTFEDSEGTENGIKRDVIQPITEKLTPQVLAICLIYAVVAFQMLYFDGKYIKTKCQEYQCGTN